LIIYQQGICPRLNFQTDIVHLNQLQPIFQNEKPDVVFHFAAKLSVPESCDKPYEYFDTNVVGTANILKLCAQYNIKKFIFSSSVSVYGEGLQGIVNEDDHKKPISHYGLTKKMAEDLIVHHSQVWPDFKFKLLRYANVSGAPVDMSNGPFNWSTGQLVHNLCRCALTEKNVKVFGNAFQTKDGTCVRDYIHVCDLADAHIKAFESLNDLNSSVVWNCSYGKGFTVLEVIKAFEDVNKLKFNIEYCGARKGDPALIMTSNHKIKTESSWSPRYDDINQICKSTFDWALAQQSMIIGKVSKSF
jgi:UDP-glucose 4-epimerase